MASTIYPFGNTFSFDATPQDIAANNATAQASKNVFYNLVNSNANLGTPQQVAQEFSNNPFGVSYSELLGRLGVGGSGAVSAPAGPSGAGTDPNQIATYNQTIDNTNQAINRLNPQLNSGLAGIDSSYQDAYNKLLLGKSQANQTYDTNVLSNKQNFVGGKNTVSANAGQTLNGLQRLLGSRGAGGSSTATIAAPQAVDRQATLQRTDLTNTFGQNAKSLDQNWGSFLQDYNNNLNSIGSQRDQGKTKLQNDIASQKANLLQTLAGLQAQRDNNPASGQGSLDAANALLNQVANSPGVAPITFNAQAYTAPNLSSYTTNPNATPTYQGQAPSNDYFSPYLSALVGKKQPGNTAAATVGG